MGLRTGARNSRREPVESLAWVEMRFAMGIVLLMIRGEFATEKLLPRKKLLTAKRSRS
jgi:hypothetical protein